tara:strand:+ start:668 stop:4342 length:3675 start_codon:yes stop_codon:yes gene_type:complete
MASQSIADFAVKIGIQGEEALQGLGKEVGVLTKSVKVSNDAFERAATGIAKYAKRSRTTTESVRAQISAFKKLQDQVGITSREYKNMAGQIRSLEQIQKRGATNKQLLAQFEGGKPGTMKNQIRAAAEELENMSFVNGEYRDGLIDVTKRQNNYNRALKEQEIIAKNLFAMDQNRPLETTRFELPDPKQGSQGVKLLSQKTGIERFFHWLMESPDWRKANRMPDPGEASPYGGYYARQIQEKTQFAYGTPKLGPELPRTSNNFQFQLGKLQESLGDLTVGSKQWNTQIEKISKAQHDYNRVLAQTNRALKNAAALRPVSTDLRTARRNLAGSRRIRDRVGGGFNQFSQDAEFGIYGDSTAIQKSIERHQRRQNKIKGFSKARNNPMAVSGLYDQISQIGMSDVSGNIDRMGKSYKEVRKDIMSATRAGNKSTNALTAQRAALEQLRGGLEIGSKGYKKLSKDLQQVEIRLRRVNKFSGKNFARTGQSILGAAYFGGPAGALGGLAGAGIEALRPGGDMAQGAISGGLLASQIVSPIANFTSQAATYSSDIAKLQIALEKATGPGENFAKAMKMAEHVTAKFNVPQEIATRGMTRLAAAVQGAGGTTEHAALAFHNVIAAIKGTAGSSEDVKSAITAMVQIFSKGKVSAEELSGQLGERFPGAVTKFQEANSHIYKSTAELQDALKNGTVGLNQLMEFVMLLGEEYTKTAADIGKSDEEAGARAIIRINALKIQLGNLIKPIGAQFQILAAEALEILIPAVVAIGKIGVAVSNVIITSLKFVIKNFRELTEVVLIFGGGLVLGKLMGGIAALTISKFALLRVVVKLKNAMKLLNLTSLANPWVALAAGIIAATVALDRFLNRNKKLAEKAASGDPQALEAAQKVLDQEMANVKKRRAEFQEYIKDFKEGGIAYKGATANFRDEIAVSEEKIKLFSKAISEGHLKNEEDASAYIDALKKAVEDMGMIWPELDAAAKKAGENSPFKQFQKELDSFNESLEQVGVNGFNKLTDTIMQFVTTGKLAFKDLVTSVLHELTRLMIQETVTKPLFGIFKKALGIGLNAAVPGTSGIGPVADLATYASDISGFTGGLDAMNDIEAGRRNALGNAFAKNGVVPYRKGGVVGNPTLFKYGGSRLGIMGEAGPEAILPLKRGRGGRLGVVMQGGGGGTTNVNYTGPTLNFNGDEYVPRSAVGGIINAAARQGASMGETSTIRTLQNNRSSRGRLGI